MYVTDNKYEGGTVEIKYKDLKTAAKRLGIACVGRDEKDIYADILAVDGRWALVDCNTDIRKVAKRLGIRCGGRKTVDIYADILATDGRWALFGREDAAKLVASKRNKAGRFAHNKARRYWDAANKIAKRWGLETIPFGWDKIAA